MIIDLIGLGYAFVYPILLTRGWIGQEEIGKPKKSMMTIVEEVSVFSGKIKQRRSWTQGRYIGMGCCGISIWDGSELELAWFRKNNSYFEINFQIFFLSDDSNKSIFKVCGVLRWVHFLVMKTFSNIFCSTFCWTWAGNCEYNLYPFFSTITDKTLFTLRASL